MDAHLDPSDILNLFTGELHLYNNAMQINVVTGSL